MLPKSITDLITSFKYLPGIGEKTAERLAFAVVNLEKEKVDFFSNSILNTHSVLRRCSICNCFSDTNVCSFCSDQSRNSNILCVVDDVKTIFLIEKLGIFRGKYHVLKGLISPIDGINPEDIMIEQLIKRLEDNSFNEVILAFRPSIEGETTALYIKTVIDGMDIIVSKLASGIPMGVDMDYVDSLTLERSLEERKKIS